MQVNVRIYVAASVIFWENSIFSRQIFFHSQRKTASCILSSSQLSVVSGLHVGSKAGIEVFPFKFGSLWV